MKVAVALSGGVDSSVALLKLLDRGYDVIAISMKMFDGEHTTEEAQRVADFFGVPFKIIDVRNEFKKEVIDYFTNEYLKGRTPNPCVVCNAKIKFGLISTLLKKLNCDLIATGHYAKITQKSGKTFVAKGQDDKKSQEYFLAFLKEETLKKTIFPLENETKESVIKTAVRHGIPFSRRGESQDVCFLQNRRHYDFIQESFKILNSPNGLIIDERTKEVVGKHSGFFNFTIGQRRKLNVAVGEKVYVSRIEPETGNVYVADRESVMKKEIKVSVVEWKYGDGIHNLSVRIRYKNSPSPALVLKKGKTAKVLFQKPVFAPATGQVAVFYDDEIVIGGGFIETT